jgi:DNA-binding MarR family transcriptional regulator
MTAATAAETSAATADHDHPQTANELSAVVDVADTVTALLRSFMRARSRMLAAAEHDVEWSSHVLLKRLSAEGPMRSSALAGCIQSDPSTVSRQVAALVRDGLVERQADPVDGRASLLALTPKAADVLVEHDAIRIQHFAAMLSGWTDRDVRKFAGLLKRFTENFESSSHDWIPERLPAGSGSSEGTI